VKNIKNNFSGMTLVELMIASIILTAVLTIVMSAYANFTSAKRKILLSSEIYNETRFLVERIVREIHNGTIDYQGYWRENLLNHTASNWVYKTNLGANPPVYEGVNEAGIDFEQFLDDNTILPISPSLNHMRNCQDPSIINADENDTNTTEKQKNILFNYRYQFIFPGLNTTNNTTSGMVHLNCLDDSFDDTCIPPLTCTDNYNIYDDEPAYGRGPRAFDEETYNTERNHAQATKMLWDWDLTDNGGVSNPLAMKTSPDTAELPPLLLLKTNETKDVYTRTAIRYIHNKIKLIRFLGEDTATTTELRDFIPDKWKCDVDFECGPSGNTTFNGSYLWSQREKDKIDDGSEDPNTGNDNGIGTITDTDLNWKDITPEKIEITHFDFILSPVKNPHKAFYEEDKMKKPQITIIIEAQAKKSSMKGIKGERPKVRIQTTATPRIWDLIEVDN